MQLSSTHLQITSLEQEEFKSTLGLQDTPISPQGIYLAFTGWELYKNSLLHCKQCQRYISHLNNYSTTEQKHSVFDTEMEHKTYCSWKNQQFESLLLLVMHKSDQKLNVRESDATDRVGGQCVSYSTRNIFPSFKKTKDFVIKNPLTVMSYAIRIS